MIATCCWAIRRHNSACFVFSWSCRAWQQGWFRGSPVKIRKTKTEKILHNNIINTPNINQPSIDQANIPKTFPDQISTCWAGVRVQPGLGWGIVGATEEATEAESSSVRTCGGKWLLKWSSATSLLSLRSNLNHHHQSNGSPLLNWPWPSSCQSYHNNLFNPTLLSKSILPWPHIMIINHNLILKPTLFSYIILLWPHIMMWPHNNLSNPTLFSPWPHIIIFFTINPTKASYYHIFTIDPTKSSYY